MKRIIKGKVYNIATAHLVAVDDTDINQAYEALYRTRRGNFFLYGYGFSCRRSGEDIIPMTPAQALVWCREHRVSADKVKRFFNIQNLEDLEYEKGM